MYELVCFFISPPLAIVINEGCVYAASTQRINYSAPILPGHVGQATKMPGQKRKRRLKKKEEEEEKQEIIEVE